MLVGKHDKLRRVTDLQVISPKRLFCHLPTGCQLFLTGHDNPMGAGRLTSLGLRHWRMITTSPLTSSVQQLKSPHIFPNDPPAGGIQCLSKTTFLALKQWTFIKIRSKKICQEQLLLKRVAELWIRKMEDTNGLSWVPKSDHTQKGTGRIRFLNFGYFIQAEDINIFY